MGPTKVTITQRLRESAARALRETYRPRCPHGEREPRRFDRAGVLVLDEEGVPRRMHAEQDEADKKESREVQDGERGVILCAKG